MVMHITEVKDGFLRPERAGAVYVQSHHCESQRSPGIDCAQDKSFHVDSEAPRGTEGGKLCPDINNALLMQKKCPTARPQAQRPCPNIWKVHSPSRLSGWRYSPSEAKMFCKLASAAQSAVVLGMDSREATLECTTCDPITTAEPGLGTEARQFNDLEVTRPSPSPNLSLQTHVSLVSTQGAPAKLCLPTVVAAVTAISPATPCSYSHNHLEAQFRKALNVLQDTTRLWLSKAKANKNYSKQTFSNQIRTIRTNMFSVTEIQIPEMETMRTVCQSFRKHLEEIEQHLREQQALFSRGIPAAVVGGARVSTGRPGSANSRRDAIGTGDGYKWTEEKNGQTACAKIHPSMAPGAAFPPSDGQRAPCCSVTHLAAFPPSTLGRNTRMSPPVLAESDPASLSNCPVGEKDTDVFL
ncbi:hypothetical protein EI555_009104 [Monodon monoceros]|uniref:Uncharacterized protein n=1 Tax=Monodon monoceros TaxID=40151 RepID=A0A4U1FRW0_MONMO|nr:hypothetical protein EI555_009104 [Monodon monoceros]